MAVLITLYESAPQWFRATFPFDRFTIDRLKMIPGATWDGNSKSWRLPGHALPALRNVGLSYQIVSRSMKPHPTPLPALMERLRPYQREAVPLMLSNPAFVLAFHPRVGKTPTCSVAIASALASGMVNTAIVMYPNQVRDEWTRQFPAFTMGLPIFPVSGTKPFDPLKYVNQPYLVLGVHYELLRAQGGRGEDGSFDASPIVQGILKLVEMRGGKLVCVADEPQLIRNRKSPRAQLFMRLGALADMRWAATGTPMRSRPRDMFPLWEFLQAGSMGSYSKYTGRYCNTPEAPIWMGDFNFKPLGDVQVGDEVIGWTRVLGPEGKRDLGGRDKLTRATVLAISKRDAPVVRVTLESGRVIRCTADHLWLDYDAIQSSGIARTVAAQRRNEEIVSLYKRGVGVTAIAKQFGISAQRAWSIGSEYTKRSSYRPPAVDMRLAFVVDPEEPHISDVRLAGWVGGMYDGEAHGHMISQSSVANPVTWSALHTALSKLGVKHTMITDRPSGAGGACLTGGRDEFLKFIRICKPVRDAGRDKILLCGRFKTPDRIVAVEPDGISTVVGLTTTTGNYVAWGYASKNCGGHLGDHGWVDKGVDNEDELRSRLHSIWIERSRRDVAPWLPKADRHIFLCDMNEAMAKAYHKAELAVGNTAMKALEGSEKGAVLHAMRQLADMTSTAKMNTMLERVRFHVAERHVKALVFALHHETLNKAWDTLKRASESRNDKFQQPIFIAGGWMLPEKRRESIAAWKKNPGPAVLLINTLSSGIGIDLADAEVAIGLEAAWVPADFIQMEARIEDVHLGKRQTPPIYEYLLTRHTVDEDMVARLIEKLAAAEAVTGMDSQRDEMATALRESNVVDRNVLTLAKEDDATVASAIDALRARLAADEETIYETSDNNEPEDLDDDDGGEEDDDDYHDA